MKKILLYLTGLALLASCSAPKYTYNFGHHKYQSVNKHGVETKAIEELVAVEVKVQEADLKVGANELVADNERTNLADPKAPLLEKIGKLSEKYRTHEATSKADAKILRKELRNDLKELKKDVKSYVKEKERLAPDSVDAVKAMDKNLKIGLILLIAAALTTWIFWPLGAALWIAGLVFLIMWLVEQ